MKAFERKVSERIECSRNQHRSFACRFARDDKIERRNRDFGASNGCVTLVKAFAGFDRAAVAAAIKTNLDAHDSRIAQRRENGVLEVFGFKGGLRASLGLTKFEIGQC